VRGREELSLLERVGVVQVAGHGRKDLDLGAAGGFVQDVNYCGWRARERPASVADLSAPRAAAGDGVGSRSASRPPPALRRRPTCRCPCCRPACALPALPLPPCSMSRWSFSPSASLPCGPGWPCDRSRSGSFVS
jgi:hypothetical protein